jgi:hypothetical protein
MEGGIKYRICQLGSDIQNYFLLFKQTKKQSIYCFSIQNIA